MQAVLEDQSTPELVLFALVFLVGLGVGSMLVLMFRRPVQDSALIAEKSRVDVQLATAEDRLRAAEAERNDARQALESARIACGQLETQTSSLQAALAATQEQHRQETERRAECQREISALKVTESRLTGDCDAARAECARLAKSVETIEAGLREETAALRARESEISSLKGDIRGMTETLRAEGEKHAALTEEIERNRHQFVAQFKAISSEILQGQGKATTEIQKTELEKIIAPFKAEMAGLQSNLKDMTERAEKERQTLGSQLSMMQAKAAELSEEANGLARALRGDKKKQGNWGETILERILEAAGLRDTVHFTRQAAARDENGSRLIPDIVVHLPGGRDVVIDSKVTLVAYQDMVQAEDAEIEAIALKRHVQAVRAHVRSLADKRYDGLGYGSADSVMMFLPVDGALTAALSSDANLIVEAAERRVHLMTPSTLMPTLKIVEHLWTIDNRNRNVDEIVDRAGKLHDKFAGVVEAIQKIGDHLKKASECQDDAIKRMSEGSGNVIGQVDKLRQLGAKARKSMPAELLGSGDDDEDGLRAIEGPSASDREAAPATGEPANADRALTGA